MASSSDISIESWCNEELISVVEAAEKTFSQQQKSSQVCNEDQVEEEVDPIDQLDSKNPENGSVIPLVKGNDDSDIIQPDREDLKLKRKADEFEEDHKPQLKKLNLTAQSTSSTSNNIKPFSLDLTDDSKPIRSTNKTNILDRFNRGYIGSDETPIDVDQIEEMKKMESKINKSNSAEKILNDFTKRICDSIYRLNKSLLDLPTHHDHHHHQQQQQQQVLKLFNYKNVQDHINLLVKQNFYNPYIIDNSRDYDGQVASDSISYGSNDLPRDLFGSNVQNKHQNFYHHDINNHFNDDLINQGPDFVDENNSSSSLLEGHDIKDDQYEDHDDEGYYYSALL